MANVKRSKYQSKQKKAFRYSDSYQNWKSAVKKWGATSPEAQHWSAEHRKRFVDADSTVELSRAA